MWRLGQRPPGLASQLWSTPELRPWNVWQQIEDKEWVLIVKPGHQVQDMKMKSLEVNLFSLPIKEFQIIDFFLGYPSGTRV